MFKSEALKETRNFDKVCGNSELPVDFHLALMWSKNGMKEFLACVPGKLIYELESSNYDIRGVQTTLVRARW